MGYPFDQHDFASPDRMIGHSYPNTVVPELSPEQERLLYLADKNGYLTGRNSILENENSDQARRIRDLEKQLETSEKDRREYTDRYNKVRDENYDLEREVDRLKQYEPKDQAEEPPQE